MDSGGRAVGEPAGPAVDAARHSYRVRGAKVYPVAAAVVVGVLVPVFYGVSGVQAALAVAAVGVVVGGLLVLYVQRSRLTIEGSQLTVSSLFSSRTADLSEIAGIRTYRTRNGTYKVICLKTGRKSIRYSQFSVDDAFRAWLSQIPDLDQQEREAVLRQIAEDQELGATPEERLGALKRAKQINIAACVVAAGAAIEYVWGGAAWRPWCFAVLAVAPAVVLFLLSRSPLLYALLRRRSDPRAEMSIVLFIASGGLFVHAVSMNFVGQNPLLGGTALVGVVFFVAFFWAARRSTQRVAATITVVLTAFFYGLGATAGADALQDPAPAQTYNVVVTGKHISRGSKSTTFYLELAPWGPYAATGNSMTVSSRTYEETNAGDVVCLKLHPGMLHVAWYEAVGCGG